MEAAARGLEPLKVPKGSFESLQKSLLGLHGGSNGSCSEAFEGAKGQFRKPTKKLVGPARAVSKAYKKACWACTAAVMEAAARPLKVPKGSFESLQKSLLGLHGGSNGSCSKGFGAFEGAKGQLRKPTKKLAGPARRPRRLRWLREKLSGGARRVLLGAAPVPAGAVVVGAARRQQWKLQRGVWSL